MSGFSFLSYFFCGSLFVHISCPPVSLELLYLCSDFSWFAKLFKFMEACYTVAIFFCLWFIFPLLFLIVFSIGFQFLFKILLSFLISECDEFNKTILLQSSYWKVSHAGFPESTNSPWFIWKFLMTESCLSLVNCFYLFFS